ncbi:HAD family hydrolase [bacterium]|nr:HAD family hydrolase [bacterium]
MIRGVFFDAGNTILFPDYEIYRRIVADLGGDASLDDVMAAEAHARAAFDAAVSAAPGKNVYGFWGVFYEPFYVHLGLRGDAVEEAIGRTRAANDIDPGIWRIPVDGFHDVMDELDRRAIVTGIISNSDGRLEERMSQIGIRDRFSFLIDSWIIGVSKPEPRIFEEALKIAPLPPDEVIYVGDYYEVDVVGARAVGMHAALFDPYGAYTDADCAMMKQFADILGIVDSLSARS